MKKINIQSGLAPILVAVIAAVVLIALGGGIYWWYRASSDQATKNEEAINKIKVADLKLDFSLSPMPALDISSFNIPMPQLTGAGSLSGIKVNSNFSYNGDVKLSAPSYEFNVAIPSVAASSVPAATGAPANIPTSAPSAGAAPTTGSAAPAVDCSQFSSVPSCSVVGGGEAYSLCKQCFPNK